MKITYLNGHRFYNAFIAGGEAVIRDKDYLNKINVFPVPDADTGTNLASTLHSIAQSARASRSLRDTVRSIAEAALMGARGNSGIIFAQFVQGFSQEITSESKLTTHAFGDLARRASQYVYKSLLSPVEGTMITVMKDWAEAVYRYRERTADFVELLTHSLQAAKRSLRDTPKKLSVLAKAGVVDAGAKGFVDFMEGVIHFIRAGRIRRHAEPAAQQVNHIPSVRHSFKNGLTFRYCSEAVITGRDMDLDVIREKLQGYGDSVIVAGSTEKLRFHVHTNTPAELFADMGAFGAAQQIKVDDMRRQYEASHRRKHPVALVTDSSCDLPQEVLDEHQIHVIPFSFNFGHDMYLDRLTISPDRVYRLMRTHPEHPTTSQPSLALVENMLSFLSTHYDSILLYHISSGLSGTYQASRQAAEKLKDKRVEVFDSRTLSLSLGLLVLRAAEAVQKGGRYADIVKRSQDWVSKTRILVDIKTLKYMVRGGRVSPAKGLLARLLNLKPLITLDEKGKAVAWGKAFGRRAAMKKNLARVADWAAEKKVWKYAVVHAQSRSRAERYAQELTRIVGFPPAFIQEISPVIGVHNGPGALAVCLMFE